MKIEEIYAIGPAISIMMNGYIESEKLISLRGTLVPARTINRTIASIPLIGKVLGGGFPIGAIGMSKDIINQINKNKNKIVFGGTFSANSFSVYAGLKVLNFIKKYNNFYEKLENKSLKFQSGINNFVLKNNIDAWVYRFDTMSRLVFSKKKIQNRMQRDFLEKNKNKKIENFKRYLFNNNIYYPPSGIIFFSLASSQKNIDKIIKIFRIGLLKYFSRN